MLRHILKKRKPSSTDITPLVTHQVLKRDLSKEKPLESYEQTPQKLRLRMTFQNFKKRLRERLPTNSDRKSSIRYYVHREGECTP